MVYLEINRNSAPSLIDDVNKYLKNDKTKVFILIYMEGCGPCNMTRPEWSKLKNVLSKDILKSDKCIIVSIDKDVASKLNKVKEANSFPTIRYITNSGENVENYEDADIKTKDRSIDSFVEWIQSKTQGDDFKKGGGYTRVTKKTRKTKKRRWSAKYKHSINCRRPRGFSQKQYCKYGRKNT